MFFHDLAIAAVVSNYHFILKLTVADILVRPLEALPNFPRVDWRRLHIEFSQLYTETFPVIGGGRRTFGKAAPLLLPDLGQRMEEEEQPGFVHASACSRPSRGFDHAQFK